MVDGVRVSISSLTPDDQFDGFTCGDEDLDAFLRDDALRLQDQGVVSVYLGRLDDGRLAGYVALLADFVLVSTKEKKDLDLKHDDHPSVPAVKIARLATLTELQGQGIGSALIDFSIDKSLSVSHEIGCRLVTLDAYLGRAEWYEHRGFIPNSRMNKALRVENEWRCPEDCPEHRRVREERVSMRYDIGAPTMRGERR
jgi:GNAT superfamily N-acetyltransferase